MKRLKANRRNWILFKTVKTKIKKCDCTYCRFFKEKTVSPVRRKAFIRNMCFLFGEDLKRNINNDKIMRCKMCTKIFK